MIAKICTAKDNATVQGLCVLAVPSTKVCSNISHLVPKIPRATQQAQTIIIHAPANYFTFAVPRGAFSRGAFGGPTGSFGLKAGPLPAAGCLRPSMKLCQKIRIGLAINTDE